MACDLFMRASTRRGAVQPNEIRSHTTAVVAATVAPVDNAVAAVATACV